MTTQLASRSADLLLAVEHLQINFAQPRPAVNDINLRIERGEILALVGESGSGKSMTARAILGLLPPGAQATGSIRLSGEEILGVEESRLAGIRGSRIGMVFQEPQTALNPVRTIGWQLREAIRAHRPASKHHARERAIGLLRQVEIPEPEKRLRYYPHQLSGGQKQRVVLALALANEPDLLLADEPTTALDVTVQAEIIALLRRLNERTGTSVVLITHNLGVVAEIADRVVVLKLGDVVEEAHVHTLFADPQHPYTRQLLAAVPALPRSPTTTDPLAAPAPRNAGLRNVGTRRAGADNAGASVLELDDVTLIYRGRRGSADFTAVSAVSLSVSAGEVLGLVGESGSGKTTLGRASAGLLKAASGSIRVTGIDLAHASARELRSVRRELALVPQDPAASLDPRMSIAQSISEPLDVHRVGSASSRRRRVAELLEAVQLPDEFATRRPHELSGGQRQRVALARALVLRPRLLVADEPTSALDVSIQADVLELFAKLQKEFGFACVFISHDLAVVHQVSDRVAVLRAGELVEIGQVDEVFAAPGHEYTRRLLDAVPVPDPSRRSKGRRRALAS